MPAKPNRVQTLFLAAVEIEEPAHRRAFLDRECAGDPGLRERVEALLLAHAMPGGLLDSPVPAPVPAQRQFTPSESTGPFEPVAEQPANRPPGEIAGALIAGRYKLVERIGEGGMGTVWVAEQTAPIRRLVALKLVKPGMDSAAVLGRFEAERQALALMDHPHIAKILDAGSTESGRPFFAMELVKGIPLTEYCDARCLPVDDRLDLFTKICSAVQHAHQKGIIHRDLKPTNILVTEHDSKPVPKVIDFGLAKALHSPHLLTERTVFTVFGAVVGTPLYMAPEQVGINALDVDTRADIYALGVVLYELLTGTTPLERRRFKEAAWDEFKRLIREEEPPTPSTRLSSSDALPSIAARRHTEPAKLGKLVRGDLDWIVMRSLEKDRNRRYETADALAQDVGRFLHDEPVLAGPPSAVYRFRKFFRRNRARVITAAAFVVVLIAGVVGSTAFGIQASLNEKVANQARGDADTQAGIARKNAADATENARLAEAEAERVRGLLHVANMGRAQDALRGRRVARARQLLDEMRPAPGETDLRGFEWHYLWNQLHTGRDVAEIHTAAPGSHNWNVDCPVLSADGRWAASARMAPPSGRPAAEDHGPPAQGAFLFHLRVWDTATAKVIFARDPAQPNNRGVTTGHDITLCPSAGLAAWGSDRSVTVYDVAANAEKMVITLDHPLGTRQGHTEGPVPPVLAFDPTGTVLAALTLVEVPGKGPMRTVRTLRLEVREVATGRRLLEIPPTEAWVAWAAGFSPDGKRLAVRYIRNGMAGPRAVDPKALQSRIAVWDVDGDKPRFELPPSDDFLATYPFTPDGRWLALIRGRSVVLYDAATGQPGRVYSQAEQPVTTFAFSRDGQCLAVGEPSGTISIHAEQEGLLDVLYGHEAEVKDLAFRPDGRLVSRARDGKVKEWAPGRFRTAIAEEPPCFFGACDAARRYVLEVRRKMYGNPPPGSKPVRPEYAVWDAVAGAAVLRRPLAIPGVDSSDAIARAASVSPGGRRVVVSPMAGTTRRTWFDRYGPQVVVPPGPFEGLAGVARFAWAAAGLEAVDYRTEVVDVATGRERLALPLGITKAVWSPGECYLLLDLIDDKKPLDYLPLERRALWDLDADPPRQRKLEAPPQALLFFERRAWEWFSADERFLTALGTVPREARFPYNAADHYLVRWDLATGGLVFSHRFPDPSVGRDDRFVQSPRGDRLARLVGVDPMPGIPALPTPELELWEVKADGDVARLWKADARWVQERDDMPTMFVQPFAHLDFSPDGRRLFLIAERETRAWDLAAGGPPVVFRGKSGVPRALALSPDDRRLVMVTAPEQDDKPDGGVTELRVWDLASGQEVLAAPIPVRMYPSVAVAWTPFDGGQLRVLGGTREARSVFVLDGKPRPPP
jgi:WD40 repeat protein